MAWAQKLAKSGNLQHNTSGFGENVYWSTENIDGARPPDMWYSEIKDFNFNKLEGQKGTGILIHAFYYLNTGMLGGSVSEERFNKAINFNYVSGHFTQVHLIKDLFELILLNYDKSLVYWYNS
jgi:hypothetical protein